MSSVTQAYGANIAFIEELYEKFRTNPDNVSASWREFFQDYVPVVDEEADALEEPQARVSGGAPVSSPALSSPPAAPVRTAAPQPVPRPTPVPADSSQKIVALRGASAKIAQNMEASLSVPTATSVRNIPVKALEENRRVINNHLSLIGQSKASFTHVIAWAIVQALKEQPRMNSAYAVQEGGPVRIDREDINLGLAIDIEKKDGTRSLLVPNVKRAQTMDFAQFLKARRRWTSRSS
jgi:multifunctional 2-oxoglutarate metabolism enzyme